MTFRPLGSRSALALFVVVTSCRSHWQPVSSTIDRRPTTGAQASLEHSIEQSAPEPARVFRAQSWQDLCAGPNAVGKPGDFVLDNGHVRAIVDDVRTGGGGFALSGGQLVDLQRADERRRAPDELGQVFNFLGRFPRQLRYTSASSEARPDGSAAVIVRGEDPRTPGLSGVTRYVLRPGRCAIELETTLTNAGERETEVGLGDAIQWAGAEHWAPGVGYALRGERRGPWIAGVGRETVYAIVAEQSAELFGPNGSAWSNPMQRSLTLAAGQSVTYKRAIGVSFASAVDDALRCAGFAPPGVRYQARVFVRDQRGQPFEGARVVLEDTDGAPWWMAATGGDGVALVSSSRAGVFRVRVTATGRSVHVSSEGRVTLGPADGGESSRVEAIVGEPSVLRVTVREGEERTDARVLVYGEGGTPEPMLGAIGRGDGARNSVLVSHREPREIPLAAGRYRVVATRGGLYTLAEAQVSLVEGEARDITLTLRRALDPERRWICGDFHTHQAPSLDSPVSARDRVLAAAAEGLDVIAATDHNVATDLTAAVVAEELDHRLVALGGDEVSTDVAVNPTGHWNLYPLRVNPRLPLNGAPDLFELAADELVQRVRREHPAAVIQLNHPRSGAPTGMFDIYGLDAETGRATRPGFTAQFDAIELWNGRYQRSIDGLLRDWLSLLRAGARITGVANSDSHAIVTQEVGYPRTCFRGSISWIDRGAGAEQAVAEQVRRALRVERDALMTDGPLLEVLRSDGRSAVGATLAVGPRGERLRVRASSLSWASAEVLERIDANGDSTPVEGARVVREGDVVRVEAEVLVRARDAMALFRVRGAQAIPVLVGEPSMVPMAISNPVFVTAASARAH